MWTLDGPAQFSMIERKSRFIAHAAPVASEADARNFLQSRHDPDANHHCWAWRIGPSSRFNDDGEPSGTAGRPILSAIEGQDLDQVVVLVIRHFGGTLLGSGGLVRAYGGSAAQCLRQAGKTELVKRTALSVACPFGDHQRLKARIMAVDRLVMLGETFDAEGVIMHLDVPDDEMAGLSGLIGDLTSGRARILPQS